MVFIKWAKKIGYSVIQVNELDGRIYKAVRLEFENLDFGKFNEVIRREKTIKGKYKVFADIYRLIVNLGFYPPGTMFHVRGESSNPVLSVEMPKLQKEVKDLPISKISKLEKFLQLKKLFYDVYHPHNYREFNGEIYFIDIEIFPKLG